MGAFVGVLERIVEELYDHHAHLTTNTANSPRLVPSGAVIVSINGLPIGTAIDARVGRSLSRADDAAQTWALRSLLAGRHNQSRVIAFTHNQIAMTVDLPAREQEYPRDGRLAFRTLQGNRGYVRIHDSLGDSDLIGDFDKALAALRQTSALIVELRDTPGGGSSTVARGILGRFVSRELRWARRPRFELPHSRIGVNVPAEQLFHVNGTPREEFIPPVAVDPLRLAKDDAWIVKALQILRQGSEREGFEPSVGL